MGMQMGGDGGKASFQYIEEMFSGEAIWSD